MSIVPFPANKTCEIYLDRGGLPNADADIGGQGVILAFLLSAYITFAAVFLAYTFGQVDASLLNHVDLHVFRVRPYRTPASFMRHGRPTRLRVHAALRQAVLALSDQQIVTGIAIMGAGFQGLRLGGIDSYHYQTILYLAWMSSSVHLSALSLLAPFLNQRPALKAWRLVGMLVLLVLLLVGLLPTVSNDWGLITWPTPGDAPLQPLPDGTGWGIPAVCFWGETWGDGVNPDAVLGYIILVLSYGWKIGALFQGPRSGYYRWLRHPVAWALETWLVKTARRHHGCSRRTRLSRQFWLLLFRLGLAVWIPYIAAMETLASFSASLWVSLLGLIFGTFQILIPRSQNAAGVGAQENSWGFGQLTPLILLIQPIGAVFEQIAVHPQAEEEELHEDGHSSSHQSPPAAREDLRIIESQRQQRARRISYTPKDFLAFCETHTPPPVASRVPHQYSKPEEILLDSWLFRCSVLLIQPALIAGSVITFYDDSLTIGIWTTENWFVVLFVFVAYIGASWLLVMVMAPWSHMGRTRVRSLERSENTPLEETRHRAKRSPDFMASSAQSSKPG